MEEKDKCNCSNDCTCDNECNCVEDNKCNEECTCDNSCCCEESKCDSKKQKKEKKNKDKELVSLLTDKVNMLNDQLLRNQAEFQNYRKRLEDENIKFKKYANEDLVKEILPIVDTFERALSLDGTGEDNKILEGFKMTYCNLISVLEKYGVKPIDGNNKPFDPNFHQAVMTDSVSDMEKGYVIDVLQKGYLLNGKVIRHAMVKVNE